MVQRLTYRRRLSYNTKSNAVKVYVASSFGLFVELISKFLVFEHLVVN